MSISASGTLADTMTHRATRDGAVVQRKSSPTGPPSDPQASERARFARALVAWTELSAPLADRWRERAPRFGLQPVQLFTREYLLQRCDGDSLPLLPFHA